MNELSPRQRWLALLSGKEIDRVPTDYWATPELHARLKADLDCAEDATLWEKLHIDRVHEYTPRWKIPHHPNDPQADPWGIRFKAVSYGAGVYDEPMSHPLAKASTPAEVQAYRWPTPDDLDYRPITDALVQEDQHYPILAGRYEPFLLYGYLRGIEQAFVDLLLYPEIADAMLGRLFDFHYEQSRRIFEAGRGKIDLFYLAEDLGSQKGPLFSLNIYRRFFRDNQRKMADLARAHGVHVFYHTDGAAGLFLPDLADVVGIEILNPIQWRCPTMDRKDLVRAWGQRLVFHGGIDNQQTLPFGTAHDVAAEVRESLEMFRSARWICAPCHRIQAITPTANVVAMFDTIHELGKSATR